MFDESRSAAKTYFKENFADNWKNIFDNLNDEEDWFAVVYSSSYVLSLDGTKILLDPSFRNPAYLDCVSDRASEDFKKVDAILISHAHDDHFCPRVAKISKGTEVLWYVPDNIEKKHIDKYGIGSEYLHIVSQGESFNIGNVKITPYNMPHTDADGTNPMPEYGYLIESSKRRLFFPVDIRNYDLSLIPQNLGKLDTVFLHVWLGRGNALNFPCEPTLTDFCRYAAAYNAEKVSLAHIYEVERNMTDMWTYTHCGAIMDKLMCISPETEVFAPKYGKKYRF